KQNNLVAQTPFLLPERAADICKNLSTPNLRRMRQRRRARVRIHGRAVSSNEKRGLVESHRRKVQQPALSASRMGPTPNRRDKDRPLVRVAFLLILRRFGEASDNFFHAI